MFIPGVPSSRRGLTTFVFAGSQSETLHRSLTQAYLPSCSGNVSAREFNAASLEGACCTYPKGLLSRDEQHVIMMMWSWRHASNMQGWPCDRDSNPGCKPRRRNHWSSARCATNQWPSCHQWPDCGVLHRSKQHSVWDGVEVEGDPHLSANT